MTAQYDEEAEQRRIINTKRKWLQFAEYIGNDEAATTGALPLHSASNTSYSPG